jgi:tetratricopeptide (TPR) repeat protein
MSEVDEPAERAAAAFEEVLKRYRVVDAFRPLHESRIWALNSSYWRHAGPAAFTQHAVPYYATSDGALSVAAADLMVAFARSRAQAGRAASRIALVELGPGIGLFGRIAAQRYARARAKDPGLPALHYLGIDCAPSMVDGVRTRTLVDLRDLAADFAVLDLATDGDRLSQIIGDRIAEGMQVLVIANYVFDSLPSTVYRREQGQIDEMLIEVRALDEGLDRLDDARLLVRLAARPSLAHDRFVGLAQRFLKKDGDQLAVNRGALLLIEALTAAIGDAGLIVVNDYPAEVHEAGVAWQHFAGSIATGVHFPTLEAFVAQVLKWAIHEPEFANPSIAGRMLIAHSDEPVVTAYRRLFSHAKARRAQTLIAAARDAREQGRSGESAACYEAAVAAQPENWGVVTEAAGFLLNVMGEPGAATRLARVAIDSNPFCAPAWNILGDCAYRDGDVPTAAAAYQQAQNVSGGDARALLNLAYCACANQRLEEALDWIARALATDANGALTSEILNRQAEIIARLPDAARGKLRFNPPSG